MSALQKIIGRSLTEDIGTVELMSGSCMGHSSMDSSLDGAHTFLLLNSYTQEQRRNS